MSHGRDAERQPGKIASETTNKTDQIKLAISDNINTEADIQRLLFTVSMRHYSLLMKQPTPRFHFGQPKRVNH